MSRRTVALVLAAAIARWMRDDPLDRRFMTHAPRHAHPKVRLQAGGGYAMMVASLSASFLLWRGLLASPGMPHPLAG